MREFTVSPTAIVDLEQIYEDGLDRFGALQAERYQHELFGRFQLLADFPGIAGPPFKVKRRDVRRFPFGSHVIIFTTTTSGVRIARVFHASMDWRRQLRQGGS